MIQFLIKKETGEDPWLRLRETETRSSCNSCRGGRGDWWPPCQPGPPPKEYSTEFFPNGHRHPVMNHIQQAGEHTGNCVSWALLSHSKVLQKLPLPLLTWQVMYWIKSHGGNKIFALKDTWLSTSKLQKKKKKNGYSKWNVCKLTEVLTISGWYGCQDTSRTVDPYS